MRDNVVRKTGENDAAKLFRVAVAGSQFGKISEQQGDLVGAVIGVGLPQCVRVNAQARHISLIVFLLPLSIRSI